MVSNFFFIHLMATCLPVFKEAAVNTTEKVPLPFSYSNLYSSIPMIIIFIFHTQQKITLCTCLFLFTYDIIMMDPALFKLLVFINVIQVMNTFLNVIHKLKLIQGPNAHIAMAILSMISLAGYSGVLNTIFLKRRFHFGRILYMAVAMLAQAVILVLSILAFDNVMTYFQAIAIIHALVGFIIIINFTAAVLVVDEQQKELEDDRIEEQNKQLQRKIEVIEALTKRASIIPFHYESSEIHELQKSIQNLDFQLKKPKTNIVGAEIEMMEMEKVMEKISEKDDIQQSMEKSS